ncbi:MAG: hypothetical protein ACI8VE_003040, partial [Natrialbaceae archaeon]
GPSGRKSATHRLFMGTILLAIPLSGENLQKGR